MPAPSPEQRKVDVANAWRQWAMNAPLDLLDEFGGELVAGRAGPRGQQTVHLEVDSDGGDVAVNLHFHEDEEE